MNDLKQKTRRQKITWPLILGIIGTVVLLLGQQRALSVMGVVYEDTLNEATERIERMIHSQGKRIDVVEISLQNHGNMPGHGVSIEASNNLERRVVRLEDQADEVGKVNQELAVAVAKLTEQVKQLNARMDRMPR